MVEAPQRTSAIRVEPEGQPGPAGVTLTLRPTGTVLRLCAPRDHEPFLAALSTAHLPLPVEPCTSGPFVSATAFWVAPGEWWLVEANGAMSETSLRDSLPVSPMAIVDLSHGRTVVRVGGKHALDLIAKGCPLDLDLEVFPPGGCPQTVLAGVNLLLHRLSDDGGFDLYIPRSYARHLWEWLRLASAEYDLLVHPIDP